jgi:hypothetical protein
MLTPHTTIISDSKTQPRVNRANLVGRMLRRDLSCLLVITLLLLSAISFSTEKIPNFKPDCETHQTQKENNRTTVAIIRISPKSTTITHTQTIYLYIQAVTQTPTQELFCFSSPSRAPPVLTIQNV